MPLENVVTHYGLHLETDGVQYLVQDGRTADNFVGIPDRPPYEVRSRYTGPCPHIIPARPEKPSAQDWEMFMAIYHDPLVQAMLPIPKQKMSKVPFFYDETGDINRWALNLCRMSSPKGPITMHAENFRTFLAQIYLCATNVCPLVISNVTTKYQVLTDEAVRTSQFLPRRLVIIGADSHYVVQDPMHRVKTNLGNLISEEDFINLPLEVLGANVLRKFARGEEIK